MRFKKFCSIILAAAVIFSSVVNTIPVNAATANDTSDISGLEMEAIDLTPEASRELADRYDGKPGITDSGVSKSSKAKSTSNEYESSPTKYINSTMNKQLVNYLSGGSGKKATVTDINKNYYKSAITFTFDNSKLGGIDANEILQYIAECISINPNLCFLSTSILRTTYSDISDVTVYSTISKSDIYLSIRKYKAFLAEIENYVRDSGGMSDTDILLYLHDRLVTSVEYSSASTSDSRIFVPVQLVLRGEAVC